jgi:hypothetical protein
LNVCEVSADVNGLAASWQWSPGSALGGTGCARSSAASRTQAAQINALLPAISLPASGSRLPQNEHESITRRCRTSRGTRRAGMPSGYVAALLATPADSPRSGPSPTRETPVSARPYRSWFGQLALVDLVGDIERDPMPNAAATSLGPMVLTRSARRVQRTVRGDTPQGSRRWLTYAVEAGWRPALVPRSRSGTRCRWRGSRGEPGSVRAGPSSLRGDSYRLEDRRVTSTANDDQ